ncbi:MAG: type II toxin-antitoxin system PemK/MazF family toxin [Sporichthyaceae bacterium]
MTLVRGRVVEATIFDNVGRKPYLVVSNNGRNRSLRSALAVRITTSEKPEIDSIVVLDAADAPLVGRVLCDDVVEVYEEDVHRDMGALSRPSMRRVDAGLKVALGLR